jgi:protein-S-isoprenylcysteine O-methyltransferase Ste14
MVLFMWLTANITSFINIPFYGSTFIAIILGIVGILFIVVSLTTLIRARTTEDPTNPSKTTTLVISGIYQYSRNPIYLGAVFILLGLSIYLTNILTVIFIPIYMLYLTRFQITPEERFLSIKFGEEYKKYQLKVRRWL